MGKQKQKKDVNTAPAKPPKDKPKTARKNGRPPIITPEVIKNLEAAFANGKTDAIACDFAGIGETTLYEYCQKFPKFAERKEALKALYEQRLVALAEDNLHDLIAAKDPQTTRWYLERRAKQKYGKEETKVEVAVENKVTVEPRGLRELPTEELEKIVADGRSNAN